MLTIFQTSPRAPEAVQDNIFKQQLKIIIEVNEEGVVGKTHYFPHHPEIRNNIAAKVRVVFDASASSNGPSIYSCLCKGLQLIPLIFDILLRFYSHFIALVIEIGKTFHQISIIPERRSYLRFLWVHDIFKNSPSIVKLRLSGVVFVVTSLLILLNGTV